jgi:3-oxoadipate enol-lactonase
MIVDNAGMPIHCEECGSGEPVVLVHGVGANLRGWDPIAKRLARAFQVIRLDLRGHGRSGRLSGATSLGDMASDVIAVMDGYGIERADLAGFSLGGLIAQLLAVEHPGRFRRLALISAVAGRTEEERERVRERASVVEREGIAGVVSAARDRWFTEEFARRHPDQIEARLKELLANDHGSYAAAYRVFAEAELADRLGEIRHPTLVMTGENDVGSNPRMARLMHERIANSELHILPGLKHSVLLEAPDLIADHLERWFGAEAPSPSSS